MRRLLFTTVVQNIGCLAAYPFSPYVSDGFGRRTAVGLGAIIMCAATVLQTASHSVSMFIGARYVVSWKDTLFSCIPFQGRRRSCLNENEKKNLCSFMIGFGLTFAAAAAPVLITEIAYPTQRGPATSLYNTLWFVGSSFSFCYAHVLMLHTTGSWGVSCETFPSSAADNVYSTLLLCNVYLV